MLEDIFANDNPHVHNRTYSYRNPRKRHDVGIDAGGPHRNEAHQNGERQQTRATGSPRVQVRLLARIASLLDSEFTVERIGESKEPSAVLEAIRAADPATIS